jgi:HK97 family phage prohead protease
MTDTHLRVSHGGGNQVRVRGYAAVFNQLSEDLGGFREQIMAGAFSGRLADDVRALINHDSNLVLGRTVANTLTMAEDAHGLAVDITLPDTQAARDLAVSMERGDVSQMSFSFTVSKDGQSWQRDGTGPWIRTIKRVARMFDVSVVTYPAYPQTDAALRSLEAWRRGHQVDPPSDDLSLYRRRLRLHQLQAAG